MKNDIILFYMDYADSEVLQLKIIKRKQIRNKLHEFDWLIMQTMKYCNCHGDNCNKDWDAAAAPASGSEVRF